MATLFREALTEDSSFDHGGVIAAWASLDDGDGRDSRFGVAVVGVYWCSDVVGDGRAEIVPWDVVFVLTGTPG